MRFVLAAVLTAAWAITPANAQQSTATGIGIANSRASSASQAVAISGQGGAGGRGGNAASTLNIIGQATPTATTSTINNTGTQTVRNVPTVFAPSLSAAGLETCLGSVSGGVGVVGTGVSFGTSIPDAGCAARLDSRTLWSMGLKAAAIARLCLQPAIYESMPDVCAKYLPRPAYAYAAQIGVEPDQVEATYTGGPVEVVERKTGLTRLCNDFDVTRHRCRVWAH